MGFPPSFARQDAVATYRYLRIGIIALVAFLGWSMVDTRLSAKCWQTSISAYFYTTTHAVFVASLCAMGILLIIYHGSTRTEDLLLDFSGFLAFIVALVPTGPPSLCGPGLPTYDDATGGVANNVRALLIGAIVGVGVYWLIKAVRKKWPLPAKPQGEDQALSPPLKWLIDLLRWGQSKLQWILLTFVIAGILFFLFFPKAFKAHGHNIAAVTMFVGIILVVVHYAWYAASEEGRRDLRKRKLLAAVYLAVAGFILGTLIVTIVLSYLLPGGWTILIEVLLILEFAVFWIVQTFDLWDEDTYSDQSIASLTEQRGR
jgi:hypothetical protein